MHGSGVITLLIIIIIIIFILYYFSKNTSSWGSGKSQWHNQNWQNPNWQQNMPGWHGDSSNWNPNYFNWNPNSSNWNPNSSNWNPNWNNNLLTQNPSDKMSNMPLLMGAQGDSAMDHSMQPMHSAQSSQPSQPTQHDMNQIVQCQMSGNDTITCKLLDDGTQQSDGNLKESFRVYPGYGGYGRWGWGWGRPYGGGYWHNPYYRWNYPYWNRWWY